MFLRLYQLDRVNVLYFNCLQLHNSLTSIIQDQVKEGKSLGLDCAAISGN